MPQGDTNGNNQTGKGMNEGVDNEGMPFVEYELEDIPKLKSRELFWPCDTDVAECYLITSEGGGKTHYRLSAEALRAWIVDEKERHKAEFFKKAEAELEKLKKDYLQRMAISRNPQRGRLLEIAEWEHVLNGTETEGLTKKQIQLRIAWADCVKGMFYTGGNEWDKWVTARERLKIRIAPRADSRWGSLQWIKPSYIDTPLRDAYARAEAANEFLKWLKDTPADTFAPSAPNEGDTGAENEANGSDEIAEVVKEHMKKFATLIPRKGEHDKAVKWLCNYFDGIPTEIDKPVFVMANKKIALAQALAAIYRRLRAKPLDWDFQRAVVPMFNCFDVKDLDAPQSFNTRLHNYMTRGAKS